MSKIFLFVLLIAVALPFCSCEFFRSPRPGRLVETWMTKNKVIKIRVSRYAEDHNIFNPGAYYVFQSSPLDRESWSEIMTCRLDDPIDIPNQQVQLVGDKIVYMFLGYKMAVTTDAGENWSIWYAVKDLPNWKLSRAVIRNVRVEADGSGIMELVSFTGREVPILHTTNFGKSWIAK